MSYYDTKKNIKRITLTGDILYDNIYSVTPTTIDGSTDLLYTYTTSSTLSLTKNTLCDILAVGSGGFGGTGAYSGGGGAGELLYLPNISIPSGQYNINVKSMLGYTPTDVRRYPPKTYTSLSARSGSGPYYKTMTLNNTGITYGSGDYIIGCSSYFSDTLDIELAFNRSITVSFFYLSSGSRYNATTGLYTGSNYLKDSNYRGEWITIRLPNAINLCYYNYIVSATPRAPSLFKIYGSNDGINWEEITQASNDTTPLTDANYPTYFGIGYSSTTTVLPRYRKILSTPSNLYQYFGICVNKIVANGSGVALACMEWELFGFEDAYSNAIPKLNILSHYRDIIPKVYNSVANLGTVSQNGSTNYRWSMTLDSNGCETNEIGTYEITCTGSATYTSNFPYSCLARTSNSSTFTCNTTSSYNSSGVYTGSRYLESASYKGEWFYIKLLSVRLLYGYSIMIGSQNANLMGEWKFYGSNDGSDGSWVEITDGSQSTRIATTDYVQNGSYFYYSKYFTNPTSYLYYGFCCNKQTTTGSFTLIWANELYLLTRDILTITDKPTSSDGSVSITKDFTTLISAKAGGNGGYYDTLISSVINPTSGGSGGGGYMNNSGATAGTAFIYSNVSGDVNNGSAGILNTNGGSGGSATYQSYTITGASVNYSLGGTGATISSSPATKSNYGYGGDGNGGAGYQGVIIIRVKNMPNLINPYYLPFTLTNMTIVNGGNEYTSANIVISGGDPLIPATASCIVVDGAIDSITSFNGGYGYKWYPNISVVGNGSNGKVSVTGAIVNACSFSFNLLSTYNDILLSNNAKLVLENAIIPAITNMSGQTVILRLVTSCYEKTFDTKKYINGNPILMNINTNSSGYTNYYNKKSDYLSVHVPRHFLYNDIKLELEVPTQTTSDIDFITNNPLQNLLLTFLIIDDDLEETKDNNLSLEVNLNDIKKNIIKI